MNFGQPNKYINGKGAYWLPDHEWLQRTLYLQFMLALADFEGYFDPTSIAASNNNPGNLRPVGASTGFQYFTTPEEGWRALQHQIKLNIKRGLTLREFFLGKPGVYPGYAPLGDNDAEVMANYLKHMTDRTGIALDVDLRQYFPYLVDTPYTTSLFYVDNGFI